MWTQYNVHRQAYSRVHPYLSTIFDHRRVDINAQVEYGVLDRLHIYLLCDIVYLETLIVVGNSSERQWQSE